jgi:HupE / UreJ protein
MKRVIVGLAALLCAVAAWAHKPSDSYLSIEVKPGGISGQWDIALRDLDLALGLDADGNGEITWGEVRARHEDIASHAAARLLLTADGRPCALSVGEQQVDEHTDGAYSVLPLTWACEAASPAAVAVDYRLFAEFDPQHRGLLKLAARGVTRTAVLTPNIVPGATSGAAAGDTARRFELGATDPWRAFVDYVREGVWHIWIGLDHILFLLSLLLPSVLVWQAAARRWAPVATFGEAFWGVLKVVTAFTLAHSITLTLAVLGVIELPSRWVESVIAASVVVAALNNVWPRVLGRLWMVAFGFGLVHGFGFASVLADLGLPGDALALALVGFNVGVELGQLAIVVLFLPLAFALRRTGLYRRALMVGGSLAIAVLAGIWLVERAAGITLLGL